MQITGIRVIALEEGWFDRSIDYARHVCSSTHPCTHITILFNYLDDKEEEQEIQYIYRALGHLPAHKAYDEARQSLQIKEFFRNIAIGTE